MTVIPTVMIASPAASKTAPARITIRRRHTNKTNLW